MLVHPYNSYNVRMDFSFIFMKELNVYISIDRKYTLEMLLRGECVWIHDSR